MNIYPAIDLRQGRVVRMRQGNPNDQTIFSDDPVATAQYWISQGATWLHVVNLDGAFGTTLTFTPQAGTTPAQSLPTNLHWLREIRRAVDVSIQFGGGLRTLEDVRRALDVGANRVMLGTAAIENPTLVSDVVRTFGAERVVITLDAQDGLVATHGWQKISDTHAVELGHRMYALGVRYVLYTDIRRDGTLSGVNVEATTRLADSTGLYVIASGGVSGMADIEALKRFEYYNIDGVVVGQALYTAALDLRQAIEVAQRPITRHSAGLIPFRRNQQALEFLLVCNLYKEQWQFPRGACEGPESEVACAKREFSGQTGMSLVRLYEDCSTTLHYTAHIRHYEVERNITYFLAEVAGEEATLTNENHCEARWVSAAEAHELFTETSPEQLPALACALRYLHQS